MAKFFFVQQSRSICRTVLFAVFLEFTIINKCASNQELCTTRHKRNIYFLNAKIGEVDWNRAWQECRRNNSILPVICNKDEQNALTNNLKSNIGSSSSAWTSGKKKNFANWIWINGRQYFEFISSSQEHESYTHVAFDKNENNYKAQDPRNKNYYLCQHSGSSCSSENVINVTSGCVKPREDDRTWFDARNQCIKNGSDLAVLTDADWENLRQSTIVHGDRSYWIGLRKYTWLWMWQGAVSMLKGNSSEDIAYTDWSNDFGGSEDECLSVYAANGEWKAGKCTEKKIVVCEKSKTTSGISSSTTITSAMPSTKITNAMLPTPTAKASVTPSTKMASALPSRLSTVASTTPGMSEFTTESGSSSRSNADPSVLLYSGVGAGILIIVICIVVIILAVRYTRKSPKKTNQSKDENNSEQTGRYEHQNRPATSSANAPANPLVAEVDSTQGVYAEIRLALLNQSEDEAETQQPGIVYAALEFQKEPTYLEPDKNGVHESGQTKVGPMGDIYAIPDAKGRTGNEPTNHPVIVTAQGDVYALPVKNSKSPTAN